MIDLFFERLLRNLKDFVLDMTLIVALTFNVFGFWRFRMLKGRKDLGILTRRDLIINPLLTICDIPWVLMMAVTLVLIPWRFLTTFVKISKHQSHFPNCCMEVVRYDLITFTFKQGLLDYMTLPFYLISILHPQHWEPIVFRLIL